MNSISIPLLPGIKKSGQSIPGFHEEVSRAPPATREGRRHRHKCRNKSHHCKKAKLPELPLTKNEAVLESEVSVSLPSAPLFVIQKSYVKEEADPVMVEKLLNIPLFSHLCQDTLEYLSLNCVVTHFSEGDLIIQEPHITTKSIYIITSGVCRLSFNLPFVKKCKEGGAEFEITASTGFDKVRKFCPPQSEIVYLNHGMVQLGGHDHFPAVRNDKPVAIGYSVEAIVSTVIHELMTPELLAEEDKVFLSRTQIIDLQESHIASAWKQRTKSEHNLDY